MSCKIFISHSSSDKLYANLLMDFLTNGLGIGHSDIFCSSISGADIPIGVDFNDYIISKIKESSEFYTIAIISNSYYNSRYCLYELGAAWGLGKANDNIIPFLVEDMDRGGPKDFIRYKQSVIGSEEKDINKLSEMLKKTSIRNVGIEKFEKERAIILKGIANENADRKEKSSVNQASEGKRQKIKLVAFDFDGTILQGKSYQHSWISVWKYLNLDASKRESLYNKHKQNPKEYNFQDWCTECVGLFKKEGLQRSHIKEIINGNDLKLANNFEDVIRVLNAFGIKIIIISGGIDTFIEEMIDDELREFIDELFVNKFIYDKNGKLESVEAYQNTESDGVGKVKTLESYCVKNKISLSEVAYVGDRINDIDVLQVVAKPIVYPADKSHPSLRARHLNFNLVHDNSMVHILPFILD
jgi:HAD superfamily phosphoserine phosphatase-like hydrolase